ncbi:hypothetical protein [Sporolactobacillus terrae]|uniref:Uncharacterized protein n=1 Tax=Sporolactobacillus terrae TaxID=269673 RepID=A0A410D5U1_9BACL|nr:hypothetical protein [Sporolactobacillus terrae]QAA21462.1 hypothetical protein C0674_01825 [Sporolactobacillus terrae]QAA24434.1 hypothetical protein C0679_01805 [Sporolactobacillus terrae]UAK16262.1 hypothetical protein K7399_15090 [Sporolactobacillus terrae]BBN97732.1 hypothetical protein St703_04370 [Sporolactobacillus terrae]
MLKSIIAFLEPNHKPEGYIFSSAKLVTGLMVLGLLLYTITGGWGTIACLALAIGLMIGRHLLVKQATNDFRDLHHAKKGYGQTRNKDYLRFIKARGEQMLRDNKALTKSAKIEIRELLAYAERYL